jgi:hypothetical protein
MFFETIEMAQGKKRLVLTRKGQKLAYTNNLKKAFDLSIAKWEFIRDNVVHDNGSNETCGLCMMHFCCEGCPIAAYVGRDQCDGTPYYDAIKGDGPIDPKKAQKELDFILKVKAAWEAGELDLDIDFE